MKRQQLLLVFLLFYFTVNYEIYKPEQVINYINLINLTQSDYNYIINSLSKIFNDTYVYNNIGKNPPQPDFDKNYYNKVDIQKELSRINTENQSLYTFYQDLVKVTSKLKDGHLYYTFCKLDSYLQNFAFLSPIKFQINKYEGKVKIFGKNNINTEFQSYFEDYENVFQKIEKNKDVPIKSVNGKHPFDFISDFGENYFGFKSTHGNFAFKYKLLEVSPTLDAFPLSLEELTHFKVIYENEEFFETDYIIYSLIDINSDQVTPNYDKLNVFFPLNIKDTLNRFPDKNKIINETINNDTLTWDYNYYDMFKCRVDSENEINIYYINLMKAEQNLQLFINTISQCALLFDSNSFPVILINDLNLGGNPSIAQSLLEALSPLSSVKMNFAYRKTDIISNFIEKPEVPKFNYNYNNCEVESGKNLFENEKKIILENNEFEIISEPSILLEIPPKDLRSILDSFKSFLKNKRKPTDIIVFTDGFSFSAGSCVIKYLQYYGGGITVGYLGNQNKKNIPFDSSLHTTAFMDYPLYYYMYPDANILFENYSLFIQMPTQLSFYHPNNLSIPLEYTITPVDEISQIYEYFNEESYDKFVSSAKEIINKYKTECNPDNKKLLLIDENCDKSFKNNYTHGGYQCGSDGKWNKTKCVASYCDLGFIFDQMKKKCVVDYCSEMSQGRVIDDETEEEEEPNNDGGKKDKKIGTTTLIIIICVGSLILIVIILFAIIRCKKTKKSDIDFKNDINDINVNLQEKSD